MVDAPRDRRLRAMELAGRARHPAELGNRDESLNVVEVHFGIRKADRPLAHYAFDGGTPASQMSLPCSKQVYSN
jgi:hypothetical protein